MSQSDVFALKNSGLNAFLLADIGEEINGSRLTMLSALARLGKDPWDEAARWDQEPKAHAIEALTANIIDMPLNAEAIQDARSTAARLILLLPRQSQQSTVKASSKPAQRVLPNWMWMAILYPWVLLALNAGMALSHRPSPVSSPSTVLPSEYSH
jgi:hypothetical protein